MKSMELDVTDELSLIRQERMKLTMDEIRDITEEIKDQI
jgi:hypothetical protein